MVGRRRKRELESSYDPPRKRARVEDHEHCSGPQLDGDQSRINTSSGEDHSRGFGTVRNHDALTGRKCKGSERSKPCRRYRRPMIRLMTSNPTCMAGTARPAANAPYRAVIAEDIAARILRECHTKAFAAGNNAKVDGLYGCGDTLHVRDLLFCNERAVESSMVPKTRRPDLRNHRFSTEPMLELVEELEDNLLAENANMMSRRRTRAVTNDESVVPVTGDGSHDGRNPPDTNCDTRDESVPERSHAASDTRHLPFDFMSSTSDTPQAESMRVQQSTQCSDVCTDVYANAHSPIKPRASKGPAMAPIDSLLSTSEHNFSDTPIRTKPNTHNFTDPATAYPLPFDFMSLKQHPPPLPNRLETVDVCALSADSVPSPLSCIGSFVRYIITFVSKIRSKFDPIRPPTPPRPTPFDACERSHAVLPSSLPPDRSSTRPQLARTVAHGNRSSALPRRAVSNRNVPCQNSDPTQVDGACHEQIQSTGQSMRTNRARSHSDASSIRPRDWEDLFKPKAGEWKCGACYYINPEEARTCDSCTALKEAPQETKVFVANDVTGEGKDEKKDGYDANIEDGGEKKDGNDDTKPTGSAQSDDIPSYQSNDADENVATAVVAASLETTPSVEATSANDDGGDGVEKTAADDGASSKRIKVDIAGTSGCDVRVAQTAISHAPEPTLERPEEGAVTSGKRMKVVPSRGMSTLAAAAMSAKATGSKRRNQSDETDSDLNQARKMSREQTDAMTMDDSFSFSSSEGCFSEDRFSFSSSEESMDFDIPPGTMEEEEFTVFV